MPSATPHEEPPIIDASEARKVSRWRFSLAAIMILITVVSLALGLIRAIPLPEEFRQVLLVFGTIWGLLGLIFVGPAWMRFVSLRQQMRERNAKLEAWVKEQQRAKRGDTSDDRSQPQV